MTFRLILTWVALCCAPALAQDNLLRNGDFADPITPWRGGTGDVVRVVREGAADDAKQFLAVRIEGTSASLGQIGQRVGVKPNFLYRLKANLRSEPAGLAMVQIKLFGQGKELKRIDLGRSKAVWTPVDAEFATPAGADEAEVLCRYVREKGSVGGTVQFASLRLLEVGQRKPVPLMVTSVDAVATFESIGVTLSYDGDVADTLRATLRYRVRGEGDWQEGLDLVYRPTEKQFRGSLLNLRPDTEYEIEVTLHDGAARLASATHARTWSEQVPIAKVVRVPAGVSDAPLLISEQGTPDGWILYTRADAAPSTIDVGTTAPAAVQVKGAAYVVIDNLILRGGSARGVHVTDSHHVRIRRCDIAGWGDRGTPSDAIQNGRFVDAAGKLINWQAGVHVGVRSAQVVVEGNFIHAPRGTANSWAHGHPAGPQGIILDMTRGNHVVRDNDIVGSESHWWNDGIESMYNEKLEGGPHRDTDISGNVIAFANDDGTELDGGQINVRYFNNWVQWTYCGVSNAPNLRGPSYVYRNLFVLTGEQRGRTNFGFKLGGDRFAAPGRTFLYHNTMISSNAGLSTGHYGRGATPVTARNNLYHAGEMLLRGKIEGNYDLDYDLIAPEAITPAGSGQQSNAIIGAPVFVDATVGDYRLAPGSPGIDAGVSVPGLSRSDPDTGAFELDAPADFPQRPGAMSALPRLARIGDRAVTIRVPPALGARWTAHPNADWLVCTPAAGATGDAEQVIGLAVGRELPVGLHRAAVSFRTDLGHVRTVLVEWRQRAAKPVSLEFEAEVGTIEGGFRKIEDARASGGAYLEPIAEAGKDQPGAVSFDVDVPADGIYYLHARCHVPGPDAGTHDSLYVSVNDAPRQQWNLQHLAAPGYHWQVYATADQRATPLPLPRGRHTLRIHPRETGVRVDAIRLANEPF